jgi:hypothetical protein
MGRIFVFSKTPEQLRRDLKQALGDPKIKKLDSPVSKSSEAPEAGSPKKTSNTN